jgi:hypothetical protein
MGNRVTNVNDIFHCIIIIEEIKITRILFLLTLTRLSGFLLDYRVIPDRPLIFIFLIKQNDDIFVKKINSQRVVPEFFTESC